MEKVVVVVVVTMREGSRGSGPRLDCENLSEERFTAASSLERRAAGEQEACDHAAKDRVGL